jgi:tetratricopeptide (TPR) repeat protein
MRNRQSHKGKNGDIFLILKKLFMPLVVVTAVVVFFLSYNVYLIDHSLEDLKLALDQTAKAQSIAEMERIGLLLDDVLIQEVSSFRMDSLNVASLEFTRNVLSTGGIKDQIRDVEFLLDKLVRTREQQRGNVFLAFDRMNRDLQNLIRFITKEMPMGALRPEIFPPNVKVDLSILKEGRRYEDNWQLKEAISAYEEFLNKYPSYPQLRLVKLWLANSYFKSMNYKEAGRLYEGLIKEAPQSEEAKVADSLLTKVKERITRRAEKTRLSGVISQLTKEPSFATDYNELSIVDAYLDKLSKETKELILYIMRGAEAIPRPAAPGIDLNILDKAKDYEESWDLKEAQALYEDFIAKYPAYQDIVSVKLLLAGVYLKLMQYERALSAYEKVAEDYPDSKESDLAKRLVSTTKEIILVYQKRQVLIDKIKGLKAASDLAQAYYNLGMVDIYIFDLDDAEKAFKKVIEFAPNTELAKRAEFILGWNYKFSARYDSGIATFSRFIEKYPKDRLAVDSTYHIADSYYKLGKYEQAAVRYEDFTDKFPDSSISEIALFQAGYTYLYNLHDPLRASAIFKKLKTMFPETDVASYVSTSLIPTSERSYRDYGFILLREGKYEESKEAFKKAIVVNKEDGWAHCGLGTACILLILFDEGIEATSEGLKRLDDEYSRAALAFAYDGKEEYLKAIEEYQYSISKNQDYLVSHYNLGRDYMIMGWYDLAAKEFKEAVRITPDFAEAHNNLGTAYWYGGETIEAEFEFKSAIAHKPKLAEAHYNLGLLYETSEKYQKAAESFSVALSLMPDFEMARRHLENVRGKMGQ